MHDRAECEEIRERLRRLEMSSATFSEQLRTLFESTRTIFRAVCIAGLLMLLSLIHGAAGGDGFNAIRDQDDYRGDLCDSVTTGEPYYIADTIQKERRTGRRTAGAEQR